MPHAISSSSTVLQAIILCGPGSSFPTFTSNPDENPKALLPIANRPMVWYPIQFCLQMGITDITLVCPPSALKALSAAMNTNPYLTSLPLPRPDILAPRGLTQNTGTAVILRLPEVRQLLKGDFVVLPCDLVCEVAGEELLQAWMVKAASPMEMLGTKTFTSGKHLQHSGGLGVWYNTKTAPMVKGEETDFVATTRLSSSCVAAATDNVSGRLVKLLSVISTDSLNDITDARKCLPIRHGLLRSNPHMRMHTTHRDAHIYIFPHWILDFVEENDRFDSIGEDVVGWWAKAGWQTGLAEKLQIPKFCNGRPASDEESSSPGSMSSTQDVSPSSHRTGKTQVSFRVNMADGQRSLDSDESAPKGAKLKVPPVLAYIHPSSGQDLSTPLIRRVDTAQLLLAISLQLAKLPSLEEVGSEGASPFAHLKKVAYPEGVKPRTTITKQDCLIAENVTIEEKTSIKESVVGANTQIKEGAKLSQCLVMEGAIVGRGCKLSKCILGRRCIIGDSSILTDCEVQENLLVEARTEDKDNKLMSSQGLEATEAEVEEVLGAVDDESPPNLEVTAAR